MGRKPQCNKKQVLMAIKGCNGIVTTVAQRLNINWHSADNYIKKWPETLAAYNDETEQVLDFAESKIMDSIRKGNTNDAKWYLSKKGKHRGYGDDLQPSLFDDLDDTPDEDIKIIIDDEPEEVKEDGPAQ